jgi:hypothetical protein
LGFEEEEEEDYFLLASKNEEMNAAMFNEWDNE